MRITCDYCDSSFDADGLTTCPNCGARLKDPMEREKKAKTETEKKRLELEEKRIVVEREKVQVQSDQAVYSFIGDLLRHVHIFPRLSSVKYAFRRFLRKIWRIVVVILVLIALYFIFSKIYPILF